MSLSTGSSNYLCSINDRSYQRIFWPKFIHFPYLFFACFFLFPYLYFPNYFSKYWLLSVPDILPSVKFRNLGDAFWFPVWKKRRKSEKGFSIRTAPINVSRKGKIATLAAASRTVYRSADSESPCPAMISCSNHARRLSSPRWCVSCGNSRGSHDVLRMTSERFTGVLKQHTKAISYIPVYTSM